MTKTNRIAIAALAAAGALWGLSVPLSKLALVWLGPGWLTAARFVLAAPVLAVAGRRGLRAALDARVAALGAVGFGLVIILQNAGVQRTSVSHGAVLVGAVPVLVAVISAAIGDGAGRPLAWAGYAVALGGIALVAGSGGSGATLPGDALVLASAALSAYFIAVQPRVLAGRDATAVTAVQFGAGVLVAVPFAGITEGLPHLPSAFAPVLAVAALAVVGTMLPFWLFAHGQARVPVAIAGAFVNLEPLVGAAIGWLAFGNTAAAPQLLGAGAVLAGIALSATAADRGHDEAVVLSADGVAVAPRAARAAVPLAPAAARAAVPLAPAAARAAVLLAPASAPAPARRPLPACEGSRRRRRAMDVLITRRATPWRRRRPPQHVRPPRWVGSPDHQRTQATWGIRRAQL